MNIRFKEKLRYYLWASYGRKVLDNLQIKYAGVYHGIVLDIGGRDRGKFQKPKENVEKWIFADINEEYQPDLVLDVSHMPQVEASSIDVVSAIKVFANVEKMEDALKECYRVLKKEGSLVFSVPFMHPVAEDPIDFQRWNEKKWRQALEAIGFHIETVEIEGLYFTVLSDMIKNLIKLVPSFFKYILYILFPLLDLLVYLDTKNCVKKNQRLSLYHQGYFIIAKK